MANNLTEVIPLMVARGLERLRNRLAFSVLCDRSWSAEAAEVGDKVRIKIPPKVATRAVVPDVVPVAAPATTVESVDIDLNKWFESPIFLTDKERMEVQSETWNMMIDAAADAMAEKINETLWDLYPEVYHFVGTAGTTPFGSDYNDATQAKKILNVNKSRQNNRFILMDGSAEANATNLSEFADTSFSSTNETIIQGEIGAKVGFDWYLDQQSPQHIGGTLSDGSSKAAEIKTQPTVGDKSVVMKATTLTGTVVVGDLFTVAGDDQQYTVTAGATAATNEITVAFEPAAKVAWAADAAVTFADGGAAGHQVNLAFHNTAFALAMRPPAQSQANALMFTQVDPITGIPLQLEITRQNAQDYAVFRALWGVKTVRPELAVRILG